MVVSCAAYGCTARFSKESNISFFRFPKDINLLKKWLIAMKRDKYTPSQSARLCSQHFMEEDFIRTNNKKISLNRNAVPTVFNFPSHLQTKKKVVRSQRLKSRKVTTNPSISKDSNFDIDTTDTPATNVIKKHRKRKIPHYFGDCNVGNLKSLKKAKLMWEIATSTISRQRKIIKYYQTKTNRMRKRIKTLQDLILHLKNTSKISDNCFSVLQECIPHSQHQVLLRQMKVSKERKYPPELRTFALTLHFYSSAAYAYVRKTYNNCLPHPNTLKKWYSVVDGSPGYTKESLDILNIKNAELKAENKNLVCGLIMDEMSIRQHVEWNGQRQVGYINYGFGMDNDALPVAKEVIVFLLVGVNCRWKLPIGYFLINGLTADERANLVKGCIFMISDMDIKITSLTFDGAASNMSMARILGANLQHPNIKPFFPHPVSKEPISIILDPCHMMKLIRNTLGDLKTLIDKSGNQIKWEYFEKLVKIQQEAGFYAGNKIRLRHINYGNEKMKVKLAVQLLSNSVADALEYFEHDLKLAEFKGASATAKFCRVFNNVFDIMNTRNNLSKNPLTKPIQENNFTFVKNIFFEISNYIYGLKTNLNEDILISKRKTGFLGILVDMKSFEIITENFIVKNKLLNYLLTYKVSQDHLEMFFSAIRSRGGFNNNPTPRQFEGAYKKLLIHTELLISKNANCVQLEDLNILTASSGKKHCDYILQQEEIDSIDDNDNDDEFGIITEPQHSQFVDDTVIYIGGFICRKILRKINCEHCSKVLISSENKARLINRKTRGKLITPSNDVVKICKIAERVFKCSDSTTGTNIVNRLINNAMRSIDLSNLFNDIDDHIKEQDALNTHSMQLCHLILKYYFTIKIHAHNKNINEIKERVRQKFTNLVQFYHQ